MSTRIPGFTGARCVEPQLPNSGSSYTCGPGHCFCKVGPDCNELRRSGRCQGDFLCRGSICECRGGGRDGGM